MMICALPAAHAQLSEAATSAPASAAQAALLDARVNHLAEELRCLVCQNQSLADSHAGLALDLKQQLRAQLAEGRSDAEVRDYLVQRYGDFVLYRPPLKPSTWGLWFAPLALVAAGLALLARRCKWPPRFAAPRGGRPRLGAARRRGRSQAEGLDELSEPSDLNVHDTRDLARAPTPPRPPP